MNDKTKILLTIMLGNAIMDAYSSWGEYPLNDVYTDNVLTAFHNRLKADGYKGTIDNIDGGSFGGFLTFDVDLTLEPNEKYNVRVSAESGAPLHFVHLGLIQSMFSTAVKSTIVVTAASMGAEEIADEKRRLVEAFTEITRDFTQEIKTKGVNVQMVAANTIKASMHVVLGHGPTLALESILRSDGTVEPKGFQLDNEAPAEKKTEAVVHTVKFPVGTFLRFHGEEQGVVVIGHTEDQVILRRMHVSASGEYVVDDEPTAWELEKLKEAVQEFRPATFAEREALVQQIAIELLAGGVTDKRLVDAIKNTIGQALASTSTIYDAAASLKLIERLPAPVLNSIKYLIANGKLIPAIKVVRSFTNLGLKPAKDLTETLMDGMGDMSGHHYSLLEMRDLLVYSISEHHEAVVEIFGEGPKGERWDEYFSNMTF